MMRAPREAVLDRFLRYVKIDTQSQEDSRSVPSTAKQWDLLRLLADELRDLDVADVRVSEAGIVYASLPSNLPSGAASPAVGFVAHVDTSPAVSGANVTPIVHARYAGGDIVLPGDPSRVLRIAEQPALAGLVGDDVITTDGTTLLGSDDKAGVAAIMTLVDTLGVNPDVPHGRVAIAFTSDEEIGRGVDHFDVPGFGADFAYTVDGDAVGEINNETWSARTASLTFHGTSTHPGTAKGVLVNAIRALAATVAALPSDMLPETTEGRQGFVHPYAGTIDVSESTLKVLLRSFDEAGLIDQEQRVRAAAAGAAAAVPGVRVDVAVAESYRNMFDVLKDRPEITEFALEAVRRAGLTPRITPIRGGTDGSRLTFKGLPCPNIFTGGHNFHSALEFNSRGGLEQTTRTLVELVQVIAGR